MARTPKWKTQQLWKQKYQKAKKPSPTPSAGAPAPTPPPAPPAPPGPMPEDETYLASSGLRQRSYDTSIGNIRDAENQTGLDYGISFGRNDKDEVDPLSVKMPSFNPDSEGFDPANPFSRASLLNRSYFTGNRVALGAYANRGQLNSGAYQRALQRNTLGYQQGTDTLLKDFQQRLSDYRQQRGDAATTRDNDLISDRRDLLGRIAAQREY